MRRGNRSRREWLLCPGEFKAIYVRVWPGDDYLRYHGA
jgi:hypothetical protein